MITRLNVTNSKFMGPVDLQLNPQYSALIGGRGTGKSTCLEYLRWALCDQPPEPSVDDDVSAQTGRRERLIAQTLKPFASQVEVHFLLNGIPHMVRRYAETNEVMLKVGTGELQPASPDDVRALLPIEAYSQRQLSSVGVRFAELTRFITRPIRARLEEIGDREAEAASESRQNFAQLLRHRTLSKAIARDKLAVESLNQQTTEMRGGLGGLSDEDRKLLGDRPAYDQADQLVAGWQRRLSQAKTELEAAQGAIERLALDGAATVPEGIPERDSLLDLQAEIQNILGDLTAALSAKSDELTKSVAEGSHVTELLDKWGKQSADFAERYAAAAERSTAHASKLEELRQLEERQRHLQASISAQEEELSGLGAPGQRHQELRGVWRKIQEERAAALKSQCDELTALSGGLIRATLEGGAEPEVLKDRIANAISGSGVRAAKVENCY